MTKQEVINELELMIEINEEDTSRVAIAYLIAYKNALYLVKQLDDYKSLQSE